MTELNNKQEEKTVEEKQEDTVESVIYGYNDKFEKEYDFTKEIGLKFIIKVHNPTVRENGKIKALRSETLYGTAQNQLTELYYETLFILNEADEGTKVITKDGAELKDYFSLDRYAREDVTLKIGEDIMEWRNRFRG